MVTRVNGDPVNSELQRGRSAEKQMGRYDGSYTPSEQRLKDSLMKQFTKYGGEGSAGNTRAWRESPIWCDDCGQFIKVTTTQCQKCLEAT